MAIEIEAIAGPLGADVRGVDPDRPLTADELYRIEAAFVERLVLRFRAMAMTPQQLVGFSSQFGELQPHIAKAYRLPEAPDVVLMVNQDAVGNFDRVGAERGVGWHSDLAYEWTPAKATFLHAVAVPDQGGNTSFLNMHHAWDEMPVGLQARVDGTFAVYRQGGRMAQHRPTRRTIPASTRRSPPWPPRPAAVTGSKQACTAQPQRVARRALSAGYWFVSLGYASKLMVAAADGAPSRRLWGPTLTPDGGDEKLNSNGISVADTRKITEGEQEFLR